jgi:uncharacterized repeat protein (TIGR01451 family)
MDPVAQAEGEKMMQWLAQQTSTPGKVAIAIQHVPLFFSERMPERRPYWVINEPFRSRELTELQRLKVRHFFAGHWHMRDEEDEPIIQHIAPSVAWPLFKSQPGYMLYTIAANGTLTSERVAPAADLSIKISASDKVGVGDTLTYSVTAKNRGPRTASGVVVTDTLPGGQEFISATTSQGNCTGSNPVICTIGSVGPGAEVRLSVIIEAESAGEISNSATVAANQYDFAQANNQAKVMTEVENRGFVLEISPSSRTTSAGGTASYMVAAIPGELGFHEQISFSCPGMSAAVTCNFAPQSMVPGNHRRESVLTVAVGPNIAGTPRRQFQWSVAALALAAVSAGFSSRKRHLQNLVLASLFLLVLGCGGGTKETRKSSQDASNSITITVKGSSSSVSRTATATLVVQ